MYHSNPLAFSTTGDGISDSAKVAAGFDPTFTGSRYYYDKNDRLVGAEYAKGLSIGYQYDGNGNIVRQAYLGYNQSTNGLPALWKFLNGLSTTNSTGTNAPFADADGDGWSNYAEWMAGSNPVNSNSVPTNPPQTAPIALVLPSANVVSNVATLTISLWDAEGNWSTPFMQYRWSGLTNWQDATLELLDGDPYSTNSRVAAPPYGTNHILVWNALADLGPNVSTNVLLRARAQDITLMGNWSPGVLFTVQTAVSPDSDNDGLPDAWEMEFFGDLSHNGMLDSDGDGVTDLAEYIADTNPTNSLSYLHISGVTFLPEGVRIDWLGGVNATQYLQRLDDLNTNFWSDISTSLPPTPISGSFTDVLGTNAMQFYRVNAFRP